MKKILCIGCFLWALSSLAQGTLEFNQIKTVTSADTVPQGKVWKVTTAYLNTDLTYTSSGSTSYSASILINGNTVYTHAWAYRHSGSTSTYDYGRSSDQSNMQLIHFPFWLSEGESLEAGTYVYGLSVIEFNVIP